MSRHRNREYAAVKLDEREKNIPAAGADDLRDGVAVDAEDWPAWQLGFETPVWPPSQNPRLVRFDFFIESKSKNRVAEAK